MMRFMRFHDALLGEEGSAANMSAKEQLMSWVQHNTQGYPSVSVKNFTSSFADGLALCAIIHKFRPDLLDFEALSPADPQRNIATALAAAQVYFGLDVYLTIPEIMKLDDKSMVVFLGEFYAGITEHAKRGRAAERIAKLVLFDQTNDKVREFIQFLAGINCRGSSSGTTSVTPRRSSLASRRQRRCCGTAPSTTPCRAPATACR